MSKCFEERITFHTYCRHDLSAPDYPEMMYRIYLFDKVLIIMIIKFFISKCIILIYIKIILIEKLIIGNYKYRNKSYELTYKLTLLLMTKYFFSRKYIPLHMWIMIKKRIHIHMSVFTRNTTLADHKNDFCITQYLSSGTSC